MSVKLLKIGVEDTLKAERGVPYLVNTLLQ